MLHIVGNWSKIPPSQSFLLYAIVVILAKWHSFICSFFSLQFRFCVCFCFARTYKKFPSTYKRKRHIRLVHTLNCYNFQGSLILQFVHFRLSIHINTLWYTINSHYFFRSKEKKTNHFYDTKNAIQSKWKRRRTKITTSEIEVRLALLSFYISAIFGRKVKVLNKITNKLKHQCDHSIWLVSFSY